MLIIAICFGLAIGLGVIVLLLGLDEAMTSDDGGDAIYYLLAGLGLVIGTSILMIIAGIYNGLKEK